MQANTCYYREVHPPTGVTAAASGFFTHTPSVLSPTPNLILAHTTEVDIYRVRCVPQRSEMVDDRRMGLAISVIP